MFFKHPYEISQEENVFLTRRSSRINRPVTFMLQDCIDDLNHHSYLLQNECGYLQAEETARVKKKESMDLNQYLRRHLNDD